MRSILTAILLVLFVSTAQGAEDDNPYKKAKVGDWVEYKMTGPNMEGTTRMTIVAKDDKEVAYEVAAKISFMGKETVAPIQKMKIDLTKSYDLVSAANLKQNNSKIEKTAEGDEKLKVGDKELDTKWTAMKATTTYNEVTVSSDYKLWFCKDVPLSGLVKMETTTSGITTKVELVASGSK